MCKRIEDDRGRERHVHTQEGREADGVLAADLVSQEPCGQTSNRLSSIVNGDNSPWSRVSMFVSLTNRGRVADEPV